MPEPRATTGQPIPGSHRPPTPSRTPTDGLKQRSPDVAQRPSLNTSPPTPTLPPIHHRESPNPRSPSNSGDQPTRMPSLPPIHVGDSGFESRVATAAATAAEERPLPVSQRERNPNLPADWEHMSKTARRTWVRDNPQLASATSQQPVLPVLPAPPQQTPSPIPKPSDWHQKSPSAKEHWLYKHN